MKERFKVKNIFTKEVLYELGVEMNKKEKTISRIIIGAYVIISILYCIWIKIRVPNHSFRLSTILAILFAIIMIWKIDKLNWYIYWLLQGKQAIGKRQAVLFYDDHFRVENESKMDKPNVSYSEIGKVLQTKNGFIIMCKKFTILVENASFIIGDPCEFKKFLQTKLKKEIEISKSIRKSKK